jgi:acetyl esterase/lipase
VVATVLLAVTPASADRPYRVERDIDYRAGLAPQPPSTRAENRLDLYWPRGQHRTSNNRLRPLVVWVHGGGWRKGDKRIGVHKKAALFTRRGYVFASVNYRLASAPFDPDAPDPNRVNFPVQPKDVGAAIGWLQRHVTTVGGDSRHVVIVGHSAGAHLASLVAVDPTYVSAAGGDAEAIDGFVSLDSPSFDIARDADPDRSDRGHASLEMLWNAFGTPSENALTGNWRRASPLAFADPSDPPGLLVTQAAVPDRVAENERMRTALSPSRTEVAALELDHREINRVLGARPDPSGETRAVTRFVRAVTGGR